MGFTRPSSGPTDASGRNSRCAGVVIGRSAISPRLQPVWLQIGMARGSIHSEVVETLRFMPCEYLFGRREGELQIAGNRRVSDPPATDVQAISQMRVFAQSALPTVIGECDYVRQGCVVERDCRGAGNRPGHIRHTIMDDALLDVRRGRVRRRPARFEATALID